MSENGAAQSGDTVTVHYTGKLEDGTVFDSSQGRDPLQFELGSGVVIPGFEEAIVGMAPGEKKVEKLPVDKAYGPQRDELKFDLPKERLPEGLEPEVGMQLQMTQPNGQPVPVRVVDVEEAVVKLDANHPLAGKDLTFEIELVAVGQPG